jgi:hypothetical protein
VCGFEVEGKGGGGVGAGGGGRLGGRRGAWVVRKALREVQLLGEGYWIRWLRMFVCPWLAYGELV